MDELLNKKEKILHINRENIKESLEESKIHGLGPAGVSGLLSLFYPEHFGTADQFVVINLKEVQDLPERAQILAIKDPKSLTMNQAALLITIMRRKAKKLNILFNTNTWTPRKVDKVLWAFRQ